MTSGSKRFGLQTAEDVEGGIGKQREQVPALQVRREKKKGRVKTFPYGME